MRGADLSVGKLGSFPLVHRKNSVFQYALLGRADGSPFFEGRLFACPASSMFVMGDANTYRSGQLPNLIRLNLSER